MKTRFTNAMTAHVWAQQSQDLGYSDHMRFEKDTLYSYRTPIARIVKLSVGSVALVTSERYSITTSSKHMPLVFRSLPETIKAFRVPNVTANRASEHAYNLANLVAEYHKRCAQFRRMLSDPYSYDSIEELSATAYAYAEAFALDPPAINATADIEAIKAYRAAREARNSTPEGIAKRERAKAKREEYRANREARDRAKRAEAIAEAVTRFRNGDPRQGYIGGRDAGNGALLRVSASGAHVETSQGATVPVDDAKRAIAFVRKFAGRTWHRNGERFRIGDFQLDSIDEGGNIRAGCHYIERAEIESLAVSLGV